MKTPERSLAQDVVHSQIAPAKVNLNLHVTGRLPDGYHELQSLVVFADLGDELKVSRPTDGQPPDAPREDRLEITGPFASLLADRPDNLVLGAIRAFRRSCPDFPVSPLHAVLEKNLPVSAGLGGGSADAAAMLRLLAVMHGSGMQISELEALAVSLGADVPACLKSQPLIMEGKGERLASLALMPDFFLVLANPLKEVSTPEVFQALQTPGGSPLPPLGNGFSSLEDLVDWLGMTRNDLMPAAVTLVPEIGEMLAELGQWQDCLHVGMSGSGASVFAIFETLEQARAAADSLKGSRPGIWCRAAGLWRSSF